MKTIFSWSLIASILATVSVSFEIRRGLEQVPEALTAATKNSEYLISKERIINGYDTDAKTAKYVALVLTYFTNGDIGSCTGTIIAANVIIFAAHCIDDKDGRVVQNVTAYVGSTVAVTGTPHVARLAYIQTGYSQSGKLNDLAVLKFAGRFVDPFSIASLPSSTTRLPYETLVYISGFGHIADGGPFATNLQSVILKVANTKICATTFGNSDMTDSNIFCIADPRYPDTDKGSCGGDSGGPLYTKLPNGVMRVMGALSLSITGSCTRYRQVSVYTNLASRSSIIREFLNGNTTAWTRFI